MLREWKRKPGGSRDEPWGGEARGSAACGGPIRVLIADDHDVVRRGFNLVLGTQPALEVTRRLNARLPHLCVLVVSSHEEPEYLLEAFEAGAAGYVLKGAPMTRLIGALRRVMEGESPLDQELAVRLIRSLFKKVNDRHGRSKPKPADRSQPSPNRSRRGNSRCWGC